MVNTYETLGEDCYSVSIVNGNYTWVHGLLFGYGCFLSLGLRHYVGWNRCAGNAYRQKHLAIYG